MKLKYKLGIAAVIFVSGVSFLVYLKNRDDTPASRVGGRASAPTIETHGPDLSEETRILMLGHLDAMGERMGFSHAQGLGLLDIAIARSESSKRSREESSILTFKRAESVMALAVLVDASNYQMKFDEADPPYPDRTRMGVARFRLGNIPNPELDAASQAR